MNGSISTLIDCAAFINSLNQVVSEEFKDTTGEIDPDLLILNDFYEALREHVTAFPFLVQFEEWPF